MKLGTCIAFFAVSLPALGVFALFAMETHLFAPKGWLETWQTLAAGLLAIGAAFVGGRYITKQIKVTLAMEADRTRRRFAAARAVMPLTLSMFSAYARTTAAALRRIHDQREGEAIPHTIILPPYPELPREGVQEFRDLVEAGEAALRDLVAALLGEVQVHASRLDDLWSELGTDTHVSLVVNVEDYILDAAEIYARCASLYNFARRQTDEIPGTITLPQMTLALHQVGLWDYVYPRLYQMVGERYPA